MKLAYAPSGKRAIPYPPVSLSVLAGAVKAAGLQEPQLLDLEMQLWAMAGRNQASLPPKGVNASSVLEDGNDDATSALGACLFEALALDPGEPLGISVMGYEQLGSALLLTKLALQANSRVILGGQFWTLDSASDVLKRIRSDQLTITIGDGWTAIAEWALNGDSVPHNSVQWRSQGIVSGTRSIVSRQPPRPVYGSLDWAIYEQYGMFSFGDSRQIRRAHLYVWDKACPYRCNFCRVSRGSNAALPDPKTIDADLAELLDLGVSQFNFMTNELNPSLAYMRRLMGIVGPRLRRQPSVAWFTYLRPDHMEATDLAALRQSGCRLIRWGVETGSQRLSDEMQKDFRLDTVSRVLRLAAEAGIANHINLLVGYPTETDADIHVTKQFISSNSDVIHSVRLNPFYLSPGSPLAARPADYDIGLTGFSGSSYDFVRLKSPTTPKDVVIARLEDMATHIKDLGISSAGVMPFDLLNALDISDDRDTALQTLKRRQPIFWDVLSPDALKGAIGGYTISGDWAETTLRRGRNYSLAVCTD